MRWCRWVLPVAVALCGQASAKVVVGEYSGHYVRGTHYDVEPTSLITIYEYHAGYIYDFDCYDDVTNRPATIQAIAPGPALSGLVELMVREHAGREFGAENVDQILFDYQSSPYPELHIKDFKIHGTLGTNPSIENHVFAIEGDFSASSVAAPVYVFDGLETSLTVGSVADTGYFHIGRFYEPYTLTIIGNLLGTLDFGNPT